VSTFKKGFQLSESETKKENTQKHIENYPHPKDKKNRAEMIFLKERS
jgi:hypothetical protein